MHLTVQDVKTNNRKTSALLSVTTNPKTPTKSICLLTQTRYICHKQIRYVPPQAKREKPPTVSLTKSNQISDSRLSGREWVKQNHTRPDENRLCKTA